MNSDNIKDFEIAPSVEVSPTSEFVYSSGELPTVITDRPSARIVALLKDSSFSKCSEQTALATYLYQAWITFPQYPNLARSLEQISMVEMRHLDALANAIVAFGGKPNFSNSNGAYWSGAYINQTSDPKRFLEQNIEAEKCGINKYREIQSQTTNQSLIALIDRIIADELLHIQIFESYLSNLN